MDPPKHHLRRRRIKQEPAKMKQDPTIAPHVMPKATQELEQPGISESIIHRVGDALIKASDDVHEQAKKSLIKVEKHDLDLIHGLEDQKVDTDQHQKPSSEDIDMPLAPKFNSIEPSVTVGKSEHDLAAGFEDQRAATKLDRKSSFNDTKMLLTPDIHLVELSIKIEKVDPDLAAIMSEQRVPIGAKQDPSCEDTEMPLAPEFDLAKPMIEVKKSDPDLASVGKQDTSRKDVEMPLAPKVDANKLTAKPDLSDSKRIFGHNFTRPALHLVFQDMGKATEAREKATGL
ncbi:hypothetical protein PENCOP_c003G07788 [Penicillium coprophilum]|uniref:Uncharacterized protein n=1 Tax=Penicillium coprophilum TaxID=36646 RepID=A0A1V6UYW3_9EURO|nr:hypothetical protein PENCOP_c003G07788 [Penicillium coprophilum]